MSSSIYNTKKLQLDDNYSKLYSLIFVDYMYDPRGLRPSLAGLVWPFYVKQRSPLGNHTSNHFHNELTLWKIPTSCGV